MTTMTGRLVLLDTNILLIASTPARVFHNQALEVFHSWPNAGAQLQLSGQIMREYLVVATRPCASNGLGLTLEKALQNAQAMLGRCSFLEESKAVSRLLGDLARQTGSSGKQLHDVNVVATALVHGVTEILTQNVEDFQRFTSMIKVTSL